jgi:acyl-coenzyme A thioesterase PaaI-like protein
MARRSLATAAKKALGLDGRDWLELGMDVLGPRRSVHALSFFPPYVGAGVRVVEVSEALDRVVVEMKLSQRNRNMFGTHFGGSLYSMCDPFLALMLLKRLGDAYIVWDKAASIQFLRPGKGTVRVTFELTQKEVDRIRHDADHSEKVEPKFTVMVLGEDGKPVAAVEKVLYVRKKPKHGAGSGRRQA